MATRRASTFWIVSYRLAAPGWPSAALAKEASRPSACHALTRLQCVSERSLQLDQPPPGQRGACILFRSDGIGRSDAEYVARERSGNGGKPQAIFTIAGGTETLFAEYLDGQPQYPSGS